MVMEVVEVVLRQHLVLVVVEHIQLGYVVAVLQRDTFDSQWVRHDVCVYKLL